MIIIIYIYIYIIGFCGKMNLFLYMLTNNFALAHFMNFGIKTEDKGGI